MKRTLLFLLCVLMGTQLFSETLFGYLFPTLAYLERTTCYYTEGDEQYRTINRLSFEDNMFEIDGNDYIEYNDFWLREDKKGRILVYSEPAKKDLVLYDFTLEVGDTLTTLNIDMVPMTEGDPILPGVKSVVVDYPIYINGELSCPIDTLIVTDVSMVMMRDSNEYKKWTFSNGMEYMEYIGNLGADFFPIIKNPWEDIPTCCIEERLVCASIYDRLIYQMDDAEMQRLNAECQCSSWASKWCDTWNVLEFNGMAFEQTAQTWQYKLAYDTIIDGKEYQAVTRHWTADEEKTKEYVAAVRFEENSKAFIYYDNAEYLLYDFNFDLIEGDTLEVFAGINNYVHFNTYKCVIKSVEQTEGGITESTYSMDIIDPFTGKVFPSPMVWKEFVGSYNGILHGDLLVPGNSNYHLLCAYKNSSIVYSTEDEVFTEYGCEYNAVGQNPENLFPTLWGLQRTSCTKTIGEDEEGTVHGLRSTLMKVKQDMIIDGKQYVLFGEGHNYDSFLLREKGNKVFVYSSLLRKDLVLYDYTLEVGDSLPALYIDWQYHDAFHQPLPYNGEVVDYNKDYDGTILPADTFIVTNISTITLLDGKEHKKWTFNNGMQYVEGIGSYGTSYDENDFYQLIANVPQYSDADSTFLVCVSKNNKLLYQMDEAEMERLGAECLCEVETSYKSQWCDTWNVMWFDGWRFDETASTSKYRLGKDTIIGDYVYSKFTSRTSVRFTNDRKVYVYYEGFDDNDPYTVDLPTGEYLAYDFSAQVGDTLEVFSGIGTYSTYPCVVDDVETAPSPCVVDDVQADLKTFPLIIKLRPLCDVDGEGNMEISSEEITWIEGVGSPEGFLISSLPCGWGGGGTFALLCAHKGDELKYTGSLYDEYGCEYNANDPLPLYPWCNQWNILAHGYLGPREPLYGAKTTIYQLGEDTIINHLRYKQLTRYASDDVNQTKTYVGAIRFTKNNRQVYFHYDNAEYLLYDFKAQVGDTLEVFAGIDNYRDHKTYKHVVTNKEPIQDEQCKVTLDVFVSLELEGEIIHEEKFTTTWIEGVGSPDGIVHNCATLREGNVVTDVLCAYVDDRRMYRTPYPDYRILDCEYNDGDFIEGAFPILSSLQRTVCNEYCGETEDDNSANNTYKQTFDKIFFENDKPYILCNDYLLREEDNKILIYSQLLNKDLVLYDFTLEVGDSLPALYIDYQQHNDMDWIPYNLDVVDYNKDFEDGTIYPADTFVVTDVSNVTLLDGKEYKKWTFNNGMEYVEGIGMYGGHRNGDFFRLIQEIIVPCNPGTHLVCVSKNGKLLYQMDDEEMERLGAECLCDYDRGPRKDNAKDGQIGGRPTPTQWNQLELDLREMENGTTILRAETFSYTLENDSIVANDKIFYQLARQSTKDTATTKSVVGALHFGKDEDNRVYFLRDGVEYVLYDFTAEPGDTVEIFAGINNYPQETTYTHVVVDKDTTEDGACRMFLEVVFPEETTTAENAEKVWLAGLGSVDGIVHNAAKRTSNAHAAPSRTAHSSDTQTSVMLCAWREDSCLYTTNHPDYDTLGCVYNIDEMTAIEDTHSPSPTTDYQKLLRDGQLLIIHKGKTYNVLGVQVK